MDFFFFFFNIIQQNMNKFFRIFCWKRIFRFVNSFGSGHFIRDDAFNNANNGPSKIFRGQPFIAYLKRLFPFRFFKGRLPYICLYPFLSTSFLYPFNSNLIWNISVPPSRFFTGKNWDFLLQEFNCSILSKKILGVVFLWSIKSKRNISRGEQEN